MKGDPFTVEIEISEPWIIVEGERNVTEQQRFWVDIDWDRAPVGEFGGTIAITGTGKQITVMVMGSKVKLSDLDRLEPMTFIEANGYVSIEAEHFARNAAVDGIKWERIPDYGRTLGSMAVFPKPCPIMNPPEHAPYLEYNVYLTTTGEVTVWVYSAPSNNIDRTRGLCYGISFDDQPVQIVDTFPKENDAFYTSRLWSIGVMDNIRKTATKHEIKTPGLHRLRFWLVDPAVVLQKIVIDAGGVKPSFLSPPESFFAQPEDGDEMD